MKIAVLNDIHGNHPALTAVLAERDVAEADVIVVGGDFVGGAQPVEVMRQLQALGDRVRFVRGNGEREVVEAHLTRPGEVLEPDVAFASWVKGQLDVRDIARLQNLPVAIELDGTIFCHATPTSDLHLFTPLTPDEDVLELFAPVRRGVVVVGHTHMQFDRRVGEIRIVNAGSVGLPYEGDPDARWALVEGPQIYLRSTPYDLDAAVQAWAESGAPGADQYVGWLRTSGSSHEAAEHFESLIAAGHNTR